MPRVRTKRPISPPSFLQPLIESIVKAPNNDVLLANLNNFDAPFSFEKSEERGLFNWVDVLNRFDDVLGEYVKQTDLDRTSASQVPSGKIVSRKLVIAVLRASLLLLKNASQDTKTVYCSSEYVSALLLDHDLNIVTLSLEVLGAYLKRPIKVKPGRYHIPLELTHRLVPFALGWGDKEQGLGMLDCCSSMTSYLSEKGGDVRLYDELQDPLVQLTRDNVRPVPPNVLPCDIRTLSEADEEQFLRSYPRIHRFSMMAAFRRARAFVSGRKARMGFVRVRLLALTALCRIHPTPEILPELFDAEPELISDIIALTKADPVMGLGDIPDGLRLVAVRCLTSCLFDRPRTSLVCSAGGVGSHHGAIPSLLRSQVVELLNVRDRSFDAPEGSNAPGSSYAMQEESTQLLQNGNFNATSAYCANPKRVSFAVDMAEAVLHLVEYLAICSSHSSPSLVTSGAIGTILPLISNDHDPAHLRAVKQAVVTIEALVEKTNNPSGSAVFREDGGMAAIAARVTYEAYNPACTGSKAGEISDTPIADDTVEENALRARGESRNLYTSLGNGQMSVSEALSHPAPSSSAASRGCLAHSSWTLLRSLLRLLSLGLGHCAVRARSLATSSLTSALRRFTARPFHYGGSIFAAAASLTTQIANAEPTILPELNKSMIHLAILNSICTGLPPSGDAIRCVPSVLSALCLSPEMQNVIKNRSPLRTYILRLATPYYGRAMHGDTAYTIGRGLDEMMRHVPTLREEGNKAIKDFLEAASRFVKYPDPSQDGKSSRHQEKSKADQDFSLNLPTKRNTNGTRTSQVMPAIEVQSGRSGGLGTSAKTDERDRERIRMDKMRLTVANNAARLTGFAPGSTENQSTILKSMLDLRYGPARAINQDGSTGSSLSSSRTPTAANCITSLVDALRNFASRDAGLVLKSVFAVAKEDAKGALEIGSELGEVWITDEESRRPAKERETREVRTKASAGAGSDAADIEMIATHDSEDSPVMNIIGPGSSQNPEGPSIERMAISKVFRSESEKKELRRKLSDTASRLRVDAVILTGLARSGPSLQPWDTAKGIPVAALLATVQRLARMHLALAYTSLNVGANSSDLSQADVTVLGKSKLSLIPDDEVSEITTRIAADVGLTQEMKRKFEADLKTRTIPPPPQACPTRKITGLGRSLALMVYAISRLYGSLSRALTVLERRSGRRPSEARKSIRSLAQYLGQSLALHLVPVRALADYPVATAADVPASFDYLRHTVDDIRITLFDEARRATQPLILQSFIAAGGGELLWQSCDVSLFAKLTKALTPRASAIYDQMKEMRRTLAPFMPKSRPVAPVSFLAGVVAASSLVQNGHPSLPSVNDLPLLTQSITGLESLAMEESDSYGRMRLYEDTWSSMSRLIVLLCKTPDLEKFRRREISDSPSFGEWLRSSSDPASGEPRGLRGSRRAAASSVSRRPSDSGNSRDERARRMLEYAVDSLKKEWSGLEIGRTAQAIGMTLLGGFVRADPNLLEREYFVLADLAAVVRLVAHLSKKLSEDESARAQLIERGAQGGRPVGGDPSLSFPSESLVRVIEEMGFDRDRGREALLRVGQGPNALNHAMELLLQSGSQSQGGENAAEEPAHREQNSSDESDEESHENENDPGRVDAEMMDIDHVAGPAQSASDSEISLRRRDRSNQAKNEDEGREEIIPLRQPSSEDTGLPDTNPVEGVIRAAAAAEVGHLRRALPKTSSGDGRHQPIISMADSILSNIGAVRESPSFVTSWPVSREAYTDAKSSLFSTLLPVCIAGTSGDGESFTNKYARSNIPFFVVELLFAVEYDGFLSDEMRLKYATILVQSLSESPAVSTAAVWAHGGGRNARRALLSKGAWSIAVSVLKRCARRRSDGDVSGMARADVEEVRSFPIHDQTQAQDDLSSCATCFLILDAVLRYSKFDKSISEISDESKVKEKEESARAANSTSSGNGAVDYISSREAGFTFVPESLSKVKGASGSKEGASESQKQYKEAVTSALLKHLKAAVRKLGIMCKDTGEDGLFPGEVEMDQLMDICIRYLKIWRNETAGEAFLALLQLIGSLTSVSVYAEKFRLASGLTILLSCKDVRAQNGKKREENATKNFARTIIRRVAEDRATLTDSFVEGIRVLGNSNRRSSNSLSRMLISCSGMMRRDLEAFVSALAISIRLRDDGGIEFKEFRNPILEQRAAESLPGRPNVVAAVGALMEVVVREFPNCRFESDSSGEARGSALVSRSSGGVSTKRISKARYSAEEVDEKFRSSQMVTFSLRMLQELVNLSPACAAALYQLDIMGNRNEDARPSDVAKDKNSAINLILQEVLPSRESSTGAPSDIDLERLMVLDERVDAARGLFEALCSRSGFLYKTGVLALAEAARIESERPSPRLAALKQYSLCISSGHSSRVLKAMFESGVADSLAMCLSKTDLTHSWTVPFINIVLVALDILGEVAVKSPSSDFRPGRSARSSPSSAYRFFEMFDSAEFPLALGSHRRRIGSGGALYGAPTAWHM